APNGAAPAPAAGPAVAGPGEYELVLTRERLDHWVGQVESADLFAFDVETDSLDALCARLVGISLAVEPGKACYIPVGHGYPGAPAQLAAETVLEALRPVLADPARRKLGHHGKYDLHVLRCHGLTVAGYAEDTMLE